MFIWRIRPRLGPLRGCRYRGTPKKSVLHKTIGAIRAGTWETINRTVLASARSERIETGGVIRLDSTVTAALTAGVQISVDQCSRPLYQWGKARHSYSK